MIAGSAQLISFAFALSRPQPQQRHHARPGGRLFLYLPVETFVVSIFARRDILDIEGLDDLIGLAFAVDVVLRRPVARAAMISGCSGSVPLRALSRARISEAADTREVRKTLKRIPTENRTPIQLITLSDPWKECRRSNSIGVSNPYSLTGTESNLKPGFDRECLFC